MEVDIIQLVLQAGSGVVVAYMMYLLFRNAQDNWKDTIDRLLNGINGRLDMLNDRIDMLVDKEDKDA